MFRQFNITLSSSRSQISSGVSGTYNDPPLKGILIQHQDDNTNPIYIGDVQVTDNLYGIKVPAPASPDELLGPVNIPLPPGTTVRASQVYVFGTEFEEVHGLIFY